CRTAADRRFRRQTSRPRQRRRRASLDRLRPPAPSVAGATKTSTIQRSRLFSGTQWTQSKLRPSVCVGSTSNSRQSILRERPRQFLHLPVASPFVFSVYIGRGARGGDAGANPQATALTTADHSADRGQISRDSPLEGAGFEPPVPFLRKYLGCC